ncbi:MAG: hypothetical protein CMJ64_26970 [Planctomycetaceae bacterium]|nr:hypothetical protein [Planctomycetaceae bacterium]
MTDENPRHEPARKLPQFGIAALLWTTFVIGFALSYLRTLGSADVFLNGILAIGIALVSGVAIGACFGRIADATYWSLMITAAAYLSVAADRAYGPIFHLAWASAGAASGSFSGAIPASRVRLQIVAASLASGVVMLLFAPALNTRPDFVFDLVAAPIIGVLVAILVQLISWLERKSYTPRYVTASWLLLAVIVGNLLVPVVLS